MLAPFVHMGPYGWPEVKQNNMESEKQIISDRDIFLGLLRGDGLMGGE